MWCLCSGCVRKQDKRRGKRKSKTEEDLEDLDCSTTSIKEPLPTTISDQCPSYSKPLMPTEPENEESDDELPELPTHVRTRCAMAAAEHAGAGGATGVRTGIAAAADNPRSHLATSRRGSLYIFRHSDDIIVTPFAQVLHTLLNARDNVVRLTGNGSGGSSGGGHADSGGQGHNNLE